MRRGRRLRVAPNAPRAGETLPRRLAEANARVALRRLLLLMFVAFATVKAVADEMAIRGFRIEDPSLRDDPRLARLIDHLEEARRDARSALGEIFALRTRGLEIEWELAGDPRAELGEPRSGGRERAGGEREPPQLEAGAGSSFEAGRTIVERDRVRVVLPARRYLSRPEKARRVVHHEAAHALLASSLGSAERYLAVPRWFREGFALLVSGEGPSRLGAESARAILRGDGIEDLRGRGRSERDLSSDGWAFLAVEALDPEARRLAERTVLAGLIARLGSGDPFPRAWEEAVRRSPGGTGAALLARARRSFDERVPAAAARKLEASIAKLASGEAAAAREVARELDPLRDPERSGALEATAAYLHARALVLAGERERALPLLEAALRERDEGPWEAESLVLVARLLADLGKAERARAFAEEAIERFPEDRSARDGAARVLESTGGGRPGSTER